MQYVHILALIDADLERLKKVRLLLTTLDTPPKGTQKRARNPPVRSRRSGPPKDKSQLRLRFRSMSTRSSSARVEGPQ